MSTESFRPLPHTPPTAISSKARFYVRLMLDLQVWTVYRDLRRRMPSYRGDVLDVGCGQSPYRFLLDRQSTRYTGIDIFDAEKFDYSNLEVVAFDGEHIPFPDASFDAVICTEVLEHAPNYQQLIDEIHRVMKNGVEAIFTVPWSARFHYIPYDYFRYTPSSLGTMFAGFTSCAITPRGTDVSVIGSKLAILWFRNLFPARRSRMVWSPLWLLLSPLFLLVVSVAHLCTRWSVGSSDDPLGYTIVVTK